jgi:hypothetical protein
MDLWVREAPQARLSFTYLVDHAKVSVDAIDLPTTQRDGWIEEAASQLLGSGATGNAAEDSYELDRRARAQLGTDWAVTFYMVRAAEGMGDLISGGATFPDGWGAFTMLGGPYTVMPYSRVWGAHFWNPPILAHEFAHNFYALDEYKQYYDAGHRASERTGYLDVDNHNLDGDPSSTMNEHCLMRGSFWAVMDYMRDHVFEFFTFGGFQWDYNICSSTLAQIAAPTTPDGFTPPVDVAPAISVGLSRGSSSELVITGQAGSGALKNANPYSSTIHPPAERHDVSADPLASVTVAWQLYPGIDFGFITLPPINAFVAGVPVAQGARVADVAETFPPAVPTGATIVVQATTRSGKQASQTFSAP